MSDVTLEDLVNLFEEWMEERDLDQVSEQQLEDFLQTNVFNNPGTVAVENATVSLLWSFNLGPSDDTSLWDNNKLDGIRNYGDSLLNTPNYLRHC